MNSKAVRKAVHNTLALLHWRRNAYRLTFGQHNASATVVLTDLAKFCHWGATPFAPDQRLTDVMIGRQQVMLRIKQHLGLSDEQLFAIYNGQAIPARLAEEDDNDG